MGDKSLTKHWRRCDPLTKEISFFYIVIVAVYILQTLASLNGRNDGAPIIQRQNFDVEITFFTSLPFCCLQLPPISLSLSPPASSHPNDN